MDIKRRKTRAVRIKDKVIGGGNPLWIQSMTNTPTDDVPATLKQIRALEKEGCDIIRVSVLDMKAASAISRIVEKINIPLVADIHFDYRLAIAAIENGAHKIRMNPGNIKKKEYIAEVINKARQYRVPIRIGLNSGSVTRSGSRTLVDDMVSECRGYLRIFQKYKFDQIVISLKAHSVPDTVEAYRKIAALTDAPLHLGVTAAGLAESGIVKSAAGIGTLLLEGIGDTFRVSLTADPIEEIRAARNILRVLDMMPGGIEIISCPTCGRCNIDLIKVVKKAEKKLKKFENRFKNKKIKVAIMGCIVNGPGEAKDADIGIAWGGKMGMLFRKGRQVRTVQKKELIETLISEVENEMV